MSNKKSKSVKEEEIKVVDEVNIEEEKETSEIAETETTKESEIVSDSKEEKETSEIAENEIEFIKEPKKTSKKNRGKVIKLTQKSATFEDGTIVKFNGKKEHSKYLKLRK